MLEIYQVGPDEPHNMPELGYVPLGWEDANVSNGWLVYYFKEYGPNDDPYGQSVAFDGKNVYIMDLSWGGEEHLPFEDGPFTGKKLSWAEFVELKNLKDVFPEIRHKINQLIVP